MTCEVVEAFGAEGLLLQDERGKVHLFASHGEHVLFASAADVEAARADLARTVDGHITGTLAIDFDLTRTRFVYRFLFL